ncbi:MAG TPA: polysaccharide deacetylase family protein [Candidatus Sumerlaeota bacterium]|nr:polysaccharide deacetylase family protein [Candidatus Sumerlaeota bacterium]HOR29422.1 polysaccharide deacetylase family protein [Candidatus Sumerlaeota bacterium]
MKPGFPILMYHALWPAGLSPAEVDAHCRRDPQLADPGARRYALDAAVFDRQLEQLARHAAPMAAQWDDLARGRGAPRQAWITFDDGHASNHELALPLLRRRGLRAAFFITTDWIGAERFMTPAMLRALRDAGMLLGSHGCSHRYLSDLTTAELDRELRESKARLEELLSEEIPALALPGGRGDGRVRERARAAGYRYLFTSRVGLAPPEGDLLALPRVPIVNDQPEAFLSRLLAGETAELARMARGARRREFARRMLGNRIYDRLRGWVMRE